MNRSEYIKLLLVDNETASGNQKQINNDIIDCVEIALSQTSDDTEINDGLGLHDFWRDIEEVGRVKKCVGPFQAAEIIAKRLGVSYVRATTRFEKAKVENPAPVVELGDFF